MTLPFAAAALTNCEENALQIRNIQSIIHRNLSKVKSIVRWMLPLPKASTVQPSPKQTI